MKITPADGIAEPMIFGIDQHAAQSIALYACAEGQSVCYEQLCSMVDANRKLLQRYGLPSLALLSCENSVSGVAAYLGCLDAEIPVCLVESDERVVRAQVDGYAPSLILLPKETAPPAGYRPEGRLAGGGYQLHVSIQNRTYPRQLHPALALMLTTSGSTGSSKLVRLSRSNLESNATSIVAYLGIDGDDRSIQSLPMQYSYGLSLINTHLLVGGMTVLTPHSFMSPEFWRDFEQAQCTSFAGVPYMYQLLRRFRCDPTSYPTLKMLTQAGGGLAVAQLKYYHELAQRNQKSFFVMYGQTEATARISYLPPERLGDKMGSIGQAIPGGALSLEALPDEPELVQIVYRGPNVMLGYATQPSDLESGDRQQGILKTGDLGRVDDDGCFYVVGRLKRIAKVFGRRVNLADIEADLQNRFSCVVAAAERDGKVHLFVENEGEADLVEMRKHVAQLLSVVPVAIRAEQVAELPRTASGKIDHRALSA